MPEDFGQLIKRARKYFNLAIGLRQADYPLFLMIQGYHILLACPISAEEDVIISPAE